MATQHMQATLFKTSVLAGIVGAGIALLLAPRTGHDTREKLREVAHKMNRRAHDMSNKAEDTMESGVDMASEKVENMQEKMRERRDNKRQSPVLTNWENEV